MCQPVHGPQRRTRPTHRVNQGAGEVGRQPNILMDSSYSTPYLCTLTLLDLADRRPRQATLVRTADPASHEHHGHLHLPPAQLGEATSCITLYDSAGRCGFMLMGSGKSVGYRLCGQLLGGDKEVRLEETRHSAFTLRRVFDWRSRTCLLRS